MPPSTPTTVQWCIMEMRFPIDFACQQGTGGGQMDCVLMVVVLPQIMHIIVFSSWVTLSSSIYVEYSPVSCSTCTLILCISSSSAINRANSLMSLRSKSSQENNTATCAATNYIKSLITCLNTLHFSIFFCAVVCLLTITHLMSHSLCCDTIKFIVEDPPTHSFAFYFRLQKAYYLLRSLISN